MSSGNKGDSSPDYIPPTAKGKRPQYFEDPATGKLLTMVVTLAEELSVTRDRLDTVEALLQTHKLLPTDAVETFEPSGDLLRRREERHGAFLQRLLRAVRVELDEATARDFPGPGGPSQ